MTDRIDVAVVGGGLAGLCVAFELRRRRPELSVRVLETSDRLGGKVLTECVEWAGGHFIVEAGPDSFLAQKPWGRQLVEALGMSDRIVPINDRPRPVSVLRAGRMVALPEGVSLIAPTRLLPFVRSSLLSPLGKLRVALDLALPARNDQDDESLGRFVRRRLGSEALEWLAEPLVAGIYSADPDRLSLQATFPHFQAMEREKRSAIRGLRAARQAASANGRSPTFLTLRDGMQELTGRLTERVASFACCRAHVERLSRTTDGAYELSFPDRPPLVAGRVVLAVPAAVAAALVDSLSPGVAASLARLRTASTGTITLAYRTSEVTRPLTGYGLVVPRREGRPINAITVASAKFPGRAPDGWSLLRVFFGGARSPGTFLADDDRLLRIVRDQLRDLLVIEEPPAFHRIFRWVDASPQYDVGHLGLVAKIESALPAGIIVAGSPYHGVGIPDIARSAAAVAERLLEPTKEAPTR